MYRLQDVYRSLTAEDEGERARRKLGKVWSDCTLIYVRMGNDNTEI